MRVRLDWDNPKLNILRESTHPQENEDLIYIAKKVCNLLVWNRGKEFAEKVCSDEFMTMDVTALLGRPRKGMTIRRYTSDYPE